jgi:YhcG PDDEXK nuclease domain
LVNGILYAGLFNKIKTVINMRKTLLAGIDHYSFAPLNDLVFYHRILKCHCLLDLKLGEFDHSDAGQMNVYLNYYKENETHQGDNAPIGIILCSGPFHICILPYLPNNWLCLLSILDFHNNL